MKSTIKQYLLCTLTIFLGHTCLQAQNTEDTIARYFNIYNRIPQEKLYVHTDKPYYSAGENIWFAGYLLNAITHKNDAKSNFITIELLNRKDSVIQRKKLRRDSCGFANNFHLPAEIPKGKYYLRGYSNWMLNLDPAFIFLKEFSVVNGINNQFHSTVHYSKTAEGDYKASVYFSNTGNYPLANMKIRYRVNGKGMKPIVRNGQTNTAGFMHIIIPKNSDNKKYENIEVEFVDKVYKYSNTFYIPEIENEDFDVTFFPEGGRFLTAQNQIVAFKAQGKDGFSRSVSGHIITQNGDTVTNITTEHDGMGLINVFPSENETYFAVVTDEANRITKKFSLPSPEKAGIKLSAVHYKGKIRYQILKTENFEAPKHLFFVIHTRGEVCLIKKIEPNYIGIIDDKWVKSGINHLLLIDGDGNPLSERLIFVNNNENPKWNVSSETKKLNPRDKVVINCQLTDSILEKGDFSVSIVDDAIVKEDTTSATMITHMLLTSDLKGYIGNPRYYFQPGNKIERHSDLLMLTHGWSRFNIGNVKQEPQINTKNFLERGQSIAGNVKGLVGQKAVKAPIIAIAPKHNIVKTVFTDNNGDFVVDGISFPDSTTFVVQARTKKGFFTVDINIEKDQRPQSYNPFPYSNDTSAYLKEYSDIAKEYYFNSGGMRVFNLKEVVVEAQSKEQEEEYSIYSGLADKTIKEDELEKYASMPLTDIIAMQPGIQKMGDGSIRIRGSNTSPIIIIDGMMYDDSTILESLSSLEIKALEIVKGAGASMFGINGAGGAIVITLKSGVEVKHSPSPGLITFNPDGYTKAVEFYHPTYDTPEKKENTTPDVRTTLYWNPHLQIDDAGKSTIIFYTNDSAPPMRIIISGVTQSGKIGHYEQKL